MYHQMITPLGFVYPHMQIFQDGSGTVFRCINEHTSDILPDYSVFNFQDPFYHSLHYLKWNIQIHRTNGTYMYIHNKLLHFNVSWFITSTTCIGRTGYSTIQGRRSISFMNSQNIVHVYDILKQFHLLRMHCLLLTDTRWLPLNRLLCENLEKLF